MLNIVLGSPVEGEITAGSVDVNGTWYPVIPDVQEEYNVLRLRKLRNRPLLIRLGRAGEPGWIISSLRDRLRINTTVHAQLALERSLSRFLWSNFGASQGWLGTHKRNRSNDLD
jgi:hypothetical protein